MTLFYRILPLLILFLLTSVPAAADQTVELYRAKELVKSQSEAQRAAAAKHALQRVLVRVSGSLASLDSPVVQSALSRAQEYVYEYSYADSDELLTTVSGEELPASELNLKFSAALIEQLLREAGLSYWPANRPNVLIWAVANQGGGLQLVTDGEFLDQLRERAQLRGLPVTLPVFDLEDHLAMPARSLWQLDESRIRSASERYRPDAIIALRYTALSDGRFRGSWQLWHGEGDLVFDGEGATASDILQQAVDTVADHFANIYAIRPSESGSASIAMLISNVDDFAAFKQVESYLSSLAVVRRVELYSVAPEGLTLKLFTDGDVEQLEHTLALKQILLPEAGVSLTVNRYQARGSLARPLRYRLAHRRLQ